MDGSWKVLIIWDFESSCTVCTSAPHWVTQIAARRLNSWACRPRNIPQLPPSSSPRPPPYPPRPSLRFPRLTSPQQSVSPNEEQMYTDGCESSFRRCSLHSSVFRSGRVSAGTAGHTALQDTRLLADQGSDILLGLPYLTPLTRARISY